MQKLLTDVFLRALKPPATGRLEVTDTKERGLSFRLSAGGATSWSFRFRDPITGKVTRQTLAPDLSLKEAREAAYAARGQVARGQNPVEEKRKAKVEARTKTFDALADRYIREHARRHKRSGEADERMLRLHVLPVWGGRRYDKIGRADVIALCEGIVEAGKPTQANRVQSLVSKVFSFALDADMIAHHPSARLRKRTKEVRGTRTLTDPELRLFWSEIGKSPNSDRLGMALRLVLLTGVRVNELAGAKLTEFERLDEPGVAAWNIPAARSKNGRAHLVPLSEPARQIAADLVALAAARKEPTTYLLPSPARRGGPIAGHALSVAMIRFGATMEKRTDPDQADAAGTWQAERPSAHDLRRTVATRLSGAGTPAEDVSALLNHARRGVTAQHYDHYDRSREKRRALDLWARLLLEIVEGQGAGNVIRLRSGQEAAR